MIKLLLTNPIIQKTVVRKRAFQHQLDTWRIWKHLNAHQTQPASSTTNHDNTNKTVSSSSLTAQITTQQKFVPTLTTKSSLTTTTTTTTSADDSSIIPLSYRKQLIQSQENIEHQVHHLLKLWHKIDHSSKTSHQLYKEQFNDEEYTEESSLERLALKFKRPYDRFADDDDDKSGYHMRKHNDSNGAEPTSQARLNKHEQKYGNDEKLQRIQWIEQERLSELSQEVFKQVGWCPIVQPSTASITTTRDHYNFDARDGKGLFLKGSCKRGTVIGLYPGMVYTSNAFRTNYCQNMDINMIKASKCDYIRQLIPGLHGGSYIDGKLWDQPFFETMYNHVTDNESVEVTTGKKNDKTTGLWNRLTGFTMGDDINERLHGHKLGLRYMHPFAQLNQVNHAPSIASSAIPNVIAAPFRVPLKFDPELLPYIPNKYFEHPSILFADLGYLRTVVFIATRDISDEEVFVDYRWGPDMKERHKDWYIPNEPENDAVLWQK